MGTTTRPTLRRFTGSHADERTKNKEVIDFASPKDALAKEFYVSIIQKRRTKLASLSMDDFTAVGSAETLRLA